jgi:hypothetical protein
MVVVVVCSGPAAAMDVAVDEATGAVTITDGDRPVLRYNYAPVAPPEGFAEHVPPGSRKYVKPRGNYIHPLLGPHGEALTDDWTEHPHHRGIYWAWPQVRYNDRIGDLHALQHVFARPTGNLQAHADDGVAEIVAENRWNTVDGSTSHSDSPRWSIWWRFPAGAGKRTEG